MNEARRAKLRQALGKLQEVEDMVSQVSDEEQEAFDNLPENFQDTDRGRIMEEAVDGMDEVMSLISEVSDAIENVIAL